MNHAEYGIMYHAEDHHWWYRTLHDLTLRFVAARRKSLGRQLDILDAGCGTGRLMSLMLHYGNVTGIDASEESLSFCTARGLSERVVKADLNTFTPGSGIYDVITCLDVLYHRGIEDEPPILGRFHEALKPGGILILNLVAFEFLRSSHDIAVHTRKRYRRSEVARMLTDAGFDTACITYRLFPLFIPMALYRLALRLFIPPEIDQEDDVASDTSLPPDFLNRLLLGVCRIENRMIERGRTFPFGTSVFAVAVKDPSA